MAVVFGLVVPCRGELVLRGGRGGRFSLAGEVGVVLVGGIGQRKKVLSRKSGRNVGEGCCSVR